MLFELHLTAAEADHARLDEWIELCEIAQIKPLLIKLDKGEHPRQMMMAAQFERPDVGGAAQACSYYKNFFETRGFEIIREKLEIPLDHAAGQLVSYYEMHVKALLGDVDVHSIDAACSWSESVASMNLLKEDDAGRQKWYLTRRTYFHDMFESSQIFDEAYARILRFIPTMRMEREAVLIDTNPELDLGWAI